MVALGQAEYLVAGHELVIPIGQGRCARASSARAGSSAGRRNCRSGARSPARWALQIARGVVDSVRLAYVIRRERLDAVVVNSTVLVAPVLAARLAGVPSIVHAQEAPKSRAARALFRVHGALATTVVAISPWIASAFEGARANVMLNPVGIPLLAPVSRAPACRERPLQLLGRRHDRPAQASGPRRGRARKARRASASRAC